MTKKLLTLAATGLAGLVLGAGIGVAAADDPGSGSRVVPPEAMDEMHDAMRDQLPPELRAQHDEMHASMAGSMGSMDWGSMGSMMGGDRAARHAEHHPGTGE